MDQTAGLKKGDLHALSDTIRAAKLLDRIFLEQVVFMFGGLSKTMFYCLFAKFAAVF
jgi:hypothetical protein